MLLESAPAKRAHSTFNIGINPVLGFEGLQGLTIIHHEVLQGLGIRDGVCEAVNGSARLKVLDRLHV